MTEATLFIKVLYSWIYSWNQPVLGNEGKDSGLLDNLPITSLTPLCCIYPNTSIVYYVFFLLHSLNPSFIHPLIQSFYFPGEDIICEWAAYGRQAQGALSTIQVLQGMYSTQAPFLVYQNLIKKDKNSSSLFQEENFLIGFVTYVLSQNLF